MSIATDLAAAQAMLSADAAIAHAVVHGPASGPSSLVATAAGNVKTLARISAEAAAAAAAGVVPFYAPIVWTTGLTAVVGPPATCVVYAGESYVCNTGHLTGATFAADAAKWTKITQAGSMPGRNRLINGDFSIDQRHEGVAHNCPTSSTTYTVDRWAVLTWGADITAQRVPGTAPNKYALQLLGASGNTALQLYQMIEAANCADLTDADCVVSLRLRSTGLTSINWFVWHASAPDNWSSPTQIASGTWSVSSGISEKSFTFNAGANAANGLLFQLYSPSDGLAAGEILLVEGAQLEKGSVPTPFEWRPFSERLAQCQRYYCKSYAPGTVLGTATALGMAGGAVVTNGSVGGSVSIQFPVAMRATPTVLSWDAAGTSGKVSYVPAAGGTTFSNNVSNSIVGGFNTSPRGFSFGYVTGAVTDGTYYGHYAANAEL